MSSAADSNPYPEPTSNNFNDACGCGCRVCWARGLHLARVGHELFPVSTGDGYAPLVRALNARIAELESQLGERVAVAQ